MPTLRQMLSSSVGRKYLMAVSGLSLVLFTILHLLGNLALYLPTGTVLNAYADNLMSYGALTTAAEVGLLAVFALHIVMAIVIKRCHAAARPNRYRIQKSKGILQSNVASRSMIISGIVLLVFLIVHVIQFRFGPSIADGYIFDLEGRQVRDLYRLVVEVFQSPVTVSFYVGAMVVLGLHLRHGFWSAFQSLGMVAPRYSRLFYATGLVLGVVLAVGFLFIPIWIYFGLGRIAF